MGYRRSVYWCASNNEATSYQRTYMCAAQNADRTTNCIEISVEASVITSASGLPK